LLDSRVVGKLDGGPQQAQDAHIAEAGQVVDAFLGVARGVALLREVVRVVKPLVIIVEVN